MANLCLERTNGRLHLFVRFEGRGEVIGLTDEAAKKLAFSILSFIKRPKRINSAIDFNATEEDWRLLRTFRTGTIDCPRCKATILEDAHECAGCGVHTL